MGVSDLVRQNQNKDEMLYNAIISTIKLYSDPTHFIFELMQNAEDAGASKMKFIMKNDMLVLLHDGIPFSESNLCSICNIGNSDKLNQPNKIGEFGVGFKSVFSICSTVNVYCDSSGYRGSENVLGPFAITIEKFTNPVDIPMKSIPSGYTTMYEFPYAIGFRYSGYDSIEELKSRLSERIKSLGYQTLLFLRNLTEISYEIAYGFNTVSRVFSIVKKPYTSKSVVAYADDIASNNKNAYLIYSADTNEAKGRSINVAYYVQMKGDKIVSFEHSNKPYTISVYFPTNQESKLPFLVQGPFSTTSNRAEVPRSTENSRLVDEITELFLSSLVDLKENDLYDLSLLDVLAKMNQYTFEPTTLFFRLRKAFIEFLKTREFIPAIEGFGKGTNVRLIRGKWLCSAFDDDALSLLIDYSGSQYYKRLSPDITSSGSYHDLHEFLNKTVGVKEIAPSDLPDMFLKNPDFYKGMGVPWQVKLITEMKNTPYLFEKKTDRTMVDVPFVLTRNGEYVKPFLYKGTEKIPNVYLYHPKVSHRSDMNFVEDGFYQELKDFFDHTLKLKVPDTNDVFIEHLKRTYTGENIDISDEQYKADIKKLLAYLDVPGSYEKIRNLLNSLNIVYVKKPGETKSHLDSINYAQPFLPFSEEGVFMEGYLSGIPNVPYVIDLMKYRNNDAIFKYFSARSSLARDLKTGEYRRTDKYGYVRDLGDFCGNMFFFRADDVIKYIESNHTKPESRTKSSYLMTLALYYCNNIAGDANAVDTGEIVHCESKILRKLKRSTWIYSKKGDISVPGKLNYDSIDLSLYPGLTKESPLIEMLGIKVSPAEKILKQIDDFSDSAKREVLDSLLYQVLGVQLSSIEKNPQLKSIEFPEQGIHDRDRLKFKIRERFLKSRKVEYRLVSRSERVSANVNEDKAFVYSVYRNIHEDCCVCQMCGKRTKHLVIAQMQANPDYEIPELNLGLCSDCHHEYLSERNRDGFDGELKKAVLNWNVDDEPTLVFRNLSIRFTQHHLYQVKLFFENMYPEDRVQSKLKTHESDRLSDENKKPVAASLNPSCVNKILPDEIRGTINEIYTQLNCLPFFIRPVYAEIPYVVRVDKIVKSGHVMMAEGVRKMNGKICPWNHSVDNGSYVWRKKKK